MDRKFFDLLRLKICGNDFHNFFFVVVVVRKIWFFSSAKVIISNVYIR